MNRSIHFGALITAFALASGPSACQSRQTHSSAEEITIAYDAAYQSSAEAFAEARAHCNGYGKNAVFVDETVDPDGRLRRRHFRCE